MSCCLLRFLRAINRYLLVACLVGSICVVPITLAQVSTKAALTAPTPGSTLSGPTVTFSWTSGTGVSQYHLDVGTSVGGSNLYKQNQGTAKSVSVTGLPVSGTIYVRLHSRIGRTWVYNDYTYTGGGTKAALTAPTPGSTLSGPTVTFSWTSGTGVSQYHLDVGTSVGGSNLYKQNQGTATSVSVTGLPASGTIYVRLHSRIGSKWSYNDYTYTGGGARWDVALWDQSVWAP